MTTVRRRQEITRIQNEGYEARRAEKHYQSCPQEYVHTMNRLHWQEGWIRADHDIEYEEKNGP